MPLVQNGATFIVIRLAGLQYFIDQVRQRDLSQKWDSCECSAITVEFVSTLILKELRTGLAGAPDHLGGMVLFNVVPSALQRDSVIWKPISHSFLGPRMYDSRYRSISSSISDCVRPSRFHLVIDHAAEIGITRFSVLYHLLTIATRPSRNLPGRFQGLDSGFRLRLARLARVARTLRRSV